MNIKHELFGRREKDKIPLEIERVLFVDPGLNGTGWAFFQRIITFGVKSVILPQKTGVISFPRSAYKDGWLQHAEMIAAAFRGVVSSLDPKCIVIEQPTLWAGSAMSHAAVVGKNGDPGDLFKLTYLVGFLGCLTHQLTGKAPTLMLPQEWKGQLPKDVVIRRLEEHGLTDLKDHSADAIGMGIAAQGKL